MLPLVEVAYKVIAFPRYPGYSTTTYQELDDLITLAAQAPHDNLIRRWTNKSEIGKKAVVVMEWLPTCIQDVAGKLVWPTIYEIAKQMASGLNHLHTVLKVPHGDLIDTNVRLTQDGNVKLTDWGFRKIRLDLQDKFPDQARTVSNGYRAPETFSREFCRVAPKDVRFGCRSDMYSYGVICWQMASGTKPFPGYTNNQIVQALTFGQSQNIDETWPQEFKKALQDLWNRQGDFYQFQRPTAQEMVEYWQRISR